MPKTVLALVLGIALALCAPAVSQPAPASEALAAGGNGLLWKASGEGGTAYLFGSIHFANDAMYPLPPAVEAAFEASDFLVVELNISPEKQAEIGLAMMQRGMLEAEDSLSDHIPDELEVLLDKYFETAGFPRAMFDRFKPWLVAITIAALELQKLGLDPALGIEQHFLGQVGEDQQILELETAQQQIDVFDEMPEKLQRLFLHRTLLELDDMQALMEQFVDAWRLGDAEALADLTFRAMEDEPELKPVYDKMITERNVAMADKIAGYLESGSTYFVLVGAGHLVGDQGIPELLSGKKIKVERQ